jgi:hypothetical protein
MPSLFVVCLRFDVTALWGEQHRRKKKRLEEPHFFFFFAVGAAEEQRVAVSVLCVGVCVRVLVVCVCVLVGRCTYVRPPPTGIRNTAMSHLEDTHL